MRSFARIVSILTFAALFMTGCAAKSKTRSFSYFDPLIEREAIYIIPFDATLVPADFGEPVFNDFVDRLNARHKDTRVKKFVILKEELKDVEPAWLVKQTYISGDIWGYMEASGCCSTELKVKSRIYLYEPGKPEPSTEIFIPEEEFFEHDRQTIKAVKSRMAKKLSGDLADAILKKLKP